MAVSDLRLSMVICTQMLMMKSDELNMLANHMGHDLQIHMDHYRLQTDIIERAKVARILMAVDSGLWKQRNGPTKLDDVREEEIPLVMDGS